VLQDLLKFSGFPEPFFVFFFIFLKRWQNTKVTQLVKEDVRDLGNIRHLSLFQVLVDILPERVVSLFSINNLREDLEVSHATLSNWIDMLENLFYCFRIYPFCGNKTIRSLKKEPKLYLWDYTEIRNNEGSKFENFIASHLLKFTHFLYDIYGHKAQLWFLKDVYGREVDFLITIDNAPWFAIEVKTKNRQLSKSLNYYGKRLNIPYLFQVVKEESIDYIQDDIRVISASKFLTSLV